MGLAAESQFHVLAVDDSLIDRKLIEKLLKVSSYQGTLNVEKHLLEISMKTFCIRGVIIVSCLLFPFYILVLLVINTSFLFNASDYS